MKDQRRVEVLPDVAQFVGEGQGESHRRSVSPHTIAVNQEVVACDRLDDVRGESLVGDDALAYGAGVSVSFSCGLFFPSGPHVLPVRVLLQVFARSIRADGILRIVQPYQEVLGGNEGTLRYVSYDIVAYAA